MKKYCLLIILCVFLSLSSGCGSTQSTSSAPEATTEAKPKTILYQSMGVSFSLPEGWTLSESDDKVLYRNDDDGMIIQINHIAGDNYSMTNETTRSGIKNYLGKSSKSVSEEQIKEDAYLYKYTSDSTKVQAYSFDGNGGVYTMLFAKYDTSPLDDSTVDTLIRDIIDTVEVTGTVPTTEQATPETTTEATTEASNSIYDDDIVAYSTKSYSIEYSKHEFGTDLEGKDVIYFFYEFENLSEKDATPMTTVSIKAFQNGVELENAVSMEAPEETQNVMKSVKNGGKLTACMGFVLEDNSDVTIECNTLFSSEEPDSQIIKIK